ncbi:MAG TPA: MarR family winged helix-turn-helix transcriptional regulator [Polyangiaceae bacterium]|nr:MarR family winged helix-turn-helix transcriptional regulator [Polyangiaceae bacterium]
MARKTHHDTQVSRETTLAIRDRCLCLHVQRAARALARSFDDAFRELGLTHGQFSLLNALNRPSPPGMGEVARLLAMDPTTLSANVKPLVRAGRIEVRTDEADRRARRLALTPAGHEALARAVPIWKRAHARLDRFTPDLERLLAELRMLSESGAGGAGNASGVEGLTPGAKIEV